MVQQVRVDETLLQQFNRVLAHVPGKTLKEETGLTTARLATIGTLKHAFENELNKIGAVVEKFYVPPKSAEELAATRA